MKTIPTNYFNTPLSKLLKETESFMGLLGVKTSKVGRPSKLADHVGLGNHYL